jgi:hypothetical protein
MKAHIGENSKLDYNKLLDELGTICYKHSLDPHYDSPFSKDAWKAGYRYSGGKSDDITIIIAECVIGT